MLLLDATHLHPADRLYPIVLDVPLRELNLLERHQQALYAFNQYQASEGDRDSLYEQFREAQRTYLGALAGFGQVMQHVRRVAATGESSSAGGIKMLANVPAPLQKLLESVPDRFSALNDVMRGREMFYYAGAATRQSTLTRFLPAKEDNEKKVMAWGAMMDGRGHLHLSLRDFRPHVIPLLDAGQKPMAERIAQDYVNAYATGLNQYLREIRQIALAGRETPLETPS